MSYLKEEHKSKDKKKQTTTAVPEAETLKIKTSADTEQNTGNICENVPTHVLMNFAICNNCCIL